MEAARGAVEDLQPGALLHREVHQHGLVLQLWVQDDHDVMFVTIDYWFSPPEKLLNAMNLW